MNYTERIDGFQIKDITYIPGYEPKEKERKFDIVKWDGTEESEYCYSVARLEWNSKEESFNFSSVGLRWLLANPTERVCKMIEYFAKLKTLEYQVADE